jgi:hypothetical protein
MATETAPAQHAGRVNPEDAYWSAPTPGVADGGLWSTPPPASELGSSQPYPAPEPGYLGRGYQGPPRSTLPPADWRPAKVVEPAPPRRLPPQDHAALDEDEARARTVTRGIALVTAALLVVILCALCGRALW